MDWQELIFGVAGGLALFLYGITLISHGLRKALGQKAAQLLEKLTNHPIKGLLVGASVTMVFQSSSLTMVTLISLINAGLLNLVQAIGVMLGAEIGTTITAQIIAFKINHYALPIIAIGFFLTFFSKNKNLKYASQVIIGFGILFLGMSFMKGGVKSLQELSFFQDMILNFSNIPILGVLAGAIFTFIVQSSSATTGLVIAMSSEGSMSLGAAIPLILGANIGTTITGIIASIQSSKTSQKLALAQVFFNVVGVGILLLFVGKFTDIVELTSTYLPRQVANAHTIFNVVSAVIGLFLVKGLAKITEKLIPGKEIQPQRKLEHIDKLVLINPPVALMQAHKEIINMAQIVEEMIGDYENLFTKYTNGDFENLLSKEKNVDYLYKTINEFLTELAEKPLGESDSQKLTKFIHIINDIERVGDHIENLARFEKSRKKRKTREGERISFSDESKEDIKVMLDFVKKIFSEAINILKREDIDIFKKVKDLEDKIDELEKKFHDNSLRRLGKGLCMPESVPFFTDIIRNLERMGDHSNNIAHQIFLKNHNKEETEI